MTPTGKGEELTLWETGRRILLKDARFAPVVRAAGPVRWEAREVDPFRYLVRSIVYQQLAGAAARTIHGRVLEALRGEVTPEKVLRVRDTTLRQAGLSQNKLAAIRDLAHKVCDGTVALHDLEERTDAEVEERLVQVRGIGPWTAHMFLLFHLRRPDVWPVGDLGVRSGYARIHGLDEAPFQKEMSPLGEPYRPWRSAAAWYCWRALEV
ncbi:MAG: DNA-3-methyladenine glycosylase family protein [Gemmatimonadota bacterium]